MTITTCPKCGSMNITTAGVCENCGWSPFAQVALCTKITGEIELKVSGKALLEDYKRLLFENNSLTARIAELEAERRWIPAGEKPLVDGWFIVLLKNGDIRKDWTFIDCGKYFWRNSGDQVAYYMPYPEVTE